MTDFILSEESAFRLGIFIGVLCLMAIWEVLSPKRKRIYARRERWFANLGLVVLDTAFMRFVLPLLAVNVAVYAQTNGFGLLNLAGLSMGVKILAGIILLDLVVYWQHRIFHKVPLLWRLHQVHHTDRDFDTTTALRFHPFEIVLSMLLKMAVVLIFGVPVVAVILFEVILNGMALFNHGNIRLPAAFEPLLRRLVVTPDMHRIHHSVLKDEYDSNFGFNLSLWDRIFSSYCDAPQAGQERMIIGQPDHQSDETRSLIFMLMLPFRRASDRVWR